MVLGYLVPTLLMFFASSDPDITQSFIAFWQPSPIYVNIILMCFSIIYGIFSPEGKATIAADKEAPDMPYLRQLYGFSFILSILVHFLTMRMLTQSTHSELTVSKTFLLTSLIRPITIIEGLRAIWLADFWVWAIATMVWCCVSVWDIRRVGLSEVSIGNAIALIALGSILIGPGAVLSACWYWREAMMARTLIPTKPN